MGHYERLNTLWQCTDIIIIIKSVIFSLSNMPALTVIRNDTFSGLDQLVTVRISGNPRLMEIEQRSFGLQPIQVAIVNLR